jgi:hypothetical protein
MKYGENINLPENLETTRNPGIDKRVNKRLTRRFIFVA